MLLRGPPEEVAKREALIRDLTGPFKDIIRSTGAPVDEYEHAQNDPFPHFLACQERFCNLYLALSIPEFEYP